MEILSVSLSQFKIHRDRLFEFQPGVNAICGENGAGKTSILEAIAWVLFDYSGGYTKDQLRHSSAKTAEVTVKFTSNRDGRTYAVRRRTGRGAADRYDIVDPQLNLKVEGIAKVEDARAWLTEHMGLERSVRATVDLPKLFETVIGIPQGTLTLDFLKSAAERRKVFDPILAVEDYKAAYLASASLEKYAIAQTQQVEARIEHLSERLTDEDTLLTQRQQLEDQLQLQRQALASLTAQMQTLTTQIQTLQQQQQQLQTLTQQQQQYTAQIQRAQDHHAQASQQLHRAEAAQQLCQLHQAAHAAYQAAEAEGQRLASLAQERDRLQRQQRQTEAQLQRLRIDQAKLQSERDRLQRTEASLSALAPQIAQQEALEAKITQLREQTHSLDLQRQTQAQQRQRLAETTQAIADLHQAMAHSQTLQDEVAKLPQIEAEVQHTQARLARIGATQQLTQDLQYLLTQGRQANQSHQTQVRQWLQRLPDLGLSPTDQQTLRQLLNAGIALHKSDLNALATLVKDLSQDGDAERLQQQLSQLQRERQTLLQHQVAIASLPEQQRQLDQHTQRLGQTQASLQALDAHLNQAPDLNQQLQASQTQLQQLNNPKTQAQLLQTQLAEAPTLERHWQTLQTQVEHHQHNQTLLVEQLLPYSDIDPQRQTQIAELERHRQGYRLYLQNHSEAQRYDEYSQSLHTLQTRLAQLTTELTTLQTQLQAAQAAFNPEELRRLESQYQQSKSDHDRLQGALPGLERDYDRLTQEIQQRQLWRQERDRAQAELARRQQTQQLITDARRIYNLSGPRITQYYLNEIVREGDRLFRELMNRPNVALTWTEDYEIQIQEGDSTWRAFRTLSGGEQMAAALAIRLALLKVLADLDLAFFDEPTTNMDRLRREQLAESLANLKSFRQLFVISHDDTFENVTENVIRVERSET